MTRPGIARAAVLIATVTVVARLTGFARVFVFARTVGPSCLGDTYFTANTVPNIVFDIIAGGALSSVLVPVIAPAAAAGDRDSVSRTFSALLTWAASILVPITLIGMLITHPLMRVLVGGGHPGCAAHDEIAVGARMLAVFMPQVVIYGLAVILIGTLQAHHRFLGPAAGPLVSSVVVIGAYAAFRAVAAHHETNLVSLRRSHELILSVGTTLGVAALLVPMIWPIGRLRLRVRPTYHFPPGVAAIIRRMAISGAVVLGSQDLVTAVALRLANDHGNDGAVVLYDLAQTVFTVPWAVAAVPLATSAFPGLTSNWQAGERDAYAATLARTARVIMVLAAAAGALMIAPAAPLAKVVVLGAPGHVSPEILSRGLVTFGPGLLGYALVALLSRALYAQGNARTPATSALGGWAVAIVASIVLVDAMPRDWTVAALGIGNSIGVTVSGVWLLWAVRRSAGEAALAGLVRASIAALAAGTAAAVSGWGVSLTLPAGGIVVNLGDAVIAGAVALAVALAVAAALDRSTLQVLLARGRLRRA